MAPRRGHDRTTETRTSLALKVVVCTICMSIIYVKQNSAQFFNPSSYHSYNSPFRSSSSLVVNDLQPSGSITEYYMNGAGSFDSPSHVPNNARRGNSSRKSFNSTLKGQKNTTRTKTTPMPQMARYVQYNAAGGYGDTSATHLLHTLLGTMGAGPPLTQPFMQHNSALSMGGPSAINVGGQDFYSLYGGGHPASPFGDPMVGLLFSAAAAAGGETSTTAPSGVATSFTTDALTTAAAADVTTLDPMTAMVTETSSPPPTPNNIMMPNKPPQAPVGPAHPTRSSNSVASKAAAGSQGMINAAAKQPVAAAKPATTPRGQPAQQAASANRKSAAASMGNGSPRFYEGVATPSPVAAEPARQTAEPYEPSWVFVNHPKVHSSSTPQLPPPPAPPQKPRVPPVHFYPHSVVRPSNYFPHMMNPFQNNNGWGMQNHPFGNPYNNRGGGYWPFPHVRYPVSGNQALGPGGKSPGRAQAPDFLGSMAPIFPGAVDPKTMDGRGYVKVNLDGPSDAKVGAGGASPKEPLAKKGTAAAPPPAPAAPPAAPPAAAAPAPPPPPPPTPAPAPPPQPRIPVMPSLPLPPAPVAPPVPQNIPQSEPYSMFECKQCIKGVKTSCRQGAACMAACGPDLEVGEMFKCMMCVQKCEACQMTPECDEVCPHLLNSVPPIGCPPAKKKR